VPDRHPLRLEEEEVEVEEEVEEQEEEELEEEQLDLDLEDSRTSRCDSGRWPSCACSTSISTGICT